MRNLMLSTFAAFAVGALSLAFASSERPPELNCHAGPIEKSYGGSSWLVYACDDNRSAVVVSGQGNPAMPFYFILYVRPDGEIQIYGEGTGARSATQAAFNELGDLDQAAVAGLAAEARAAKEAP